MYSFGAEVVRAPRLLHGKTSMIYNDGKRIYKGIENPFEATLGIIYLIVKPNTLPICFVVSAWTKEKK